MTQHLQSTSPAETRRIAPLIAAELGATEIVFLRGEMGAGKTLLVGALVDALGGDAAQVASPTYGLLHEYRTSHGVLRHLDLYRLADPAEVLGLQLDEVYGKGPILIEWPERAAGFLGTPTVEIEITITGETGRIVEISRPDSQP